MGRPVPETQKGADREQCAKIPCERLKLASRDPWNQHLSWLVPGKTPVVYGVCGSGFPTSAGSATGAGGLHGASLDGNFLANPASCTQRSLRGGRRRGTTPPSLYSEVQTHTSVSFGSLCTFLLPSLSPDPIPGEGAGHRPADQRPAASFRGRHLLKVALGRAKEGGGRLGFRGLLAKGKLMPTKCTSLCLQGPAPCTEGGGPW